jgi:hypothetical protein
MDGVTTKHDGSATQGQALTRAARQSGGGAYPTSVAIEVLLLWPRGLDGRPSTIEETRLWPVFVMVVTEPADEDAGASRPLFDLLNRPKRDNELTVVTAESAWSVLDPANALLEVTVRAVAPVAFDLRILLPAAQVLGILDVVASGATIGITTRNRADRLRGRVDIRTALHDVVLVSCPPSLELAALAHTQLAAREGESAW